MRTRALIFTFLLTICAFTSKAQIVNTVAGGGTGGLGDGGVATLATLGYFGSVALDAIGNIFIADVNNHRVRKVDFSTGIITTYAGNGSAGYNGDNILATSAQLNFPGYIAINGNGDLFISDYQNERIRKVDASTGIIVTVAGDGTTGFSGDGALATQASINHPQGICFDDSGNLYISDDANNRIRKVNNNGIIATVCGTGVGGNNGDGGPAISAEISGIFGICVDNNNNIYLACTNYAIIRQINLTTGTISTVVGSGNVGFSGDGGIATSADLNWPFSVAFDSDNNMYIADAVNNRIRKVNNSGIINTVVGDGITGFDGDGGPPDTATFNRPSGVALDTCGNIYIADKMNKRVRKVTFNDTCGLTSTHTINAQTQSIYIYPNPAYSQIIIVANSKLREIAVTNTLGQQVLQQNINKEKAEVNIAHLQPGIYFVRVTDAKGVKVVKKIIKE